MAGRVALGVKRALDLAGAALGLALLSPVLAAVAVAIRSTLGSPVLFRQVRPGLHGRSFTILKFRSMRDPRPGEVWYLTNEQRMGRLGRFLRATSLDELPELWNVLRGEMSLVGPRPLLVHYLETYTPQEARRHDVRPGITGWAAVNGRHAIRFKERLALDVWYVDHWSLGLDLRILARTVAQVALRKDVAISEDLSLGFPLPGPDRRAQGQPDEAAPGRAGEEAGSACRRAEAKPEHRRPAGRELPRSGSEGPPAQWREG